MTKAQKRAMRDREIAICLSQLSGKFTTQMALEHLKSNGYIQTPDDAVHQMELEQTRKYLQRSGKFRNQDDSGHILFVNLVETLEDGSKFQYYKKAWECNEAEAVQHMTILYKRRKYWDVQMNRFNKVFTKNLGKKYQRLLPFDLPKPEPSMQMA